MNRTFCRRRCRRYLVGLLGLTAVISVSGCKTTPGNVKRGSSGQLIIRRVACIYDQNPWLNLDREGDKDVEGFSFRAFLDPGTGRGVHADGTFHIEMYRIDREPETRAPIDRVLVSDWHLRSADIPTIVKPGMLGEGYVPHLAWADKELAGSEVDIVVMFEDDDGNVARAGTKSLRIPKYGR